MYCTIKNVLGLCPAAGRWPTRRSCSVPHYDHLGRGIHNALHSKSGAIHHGADDNASGVAAIIEIARAMARRPQKLPRQLLFIAFTGEEWGYFGSSHYVNHPVLPLEKTIAMLNFDMVGRLRNNTLIMKALPTGAGLSRVVRARQSPARLPAHRAGRRLGLQRLRRVLRQEAAGDGLLHRPPRRLSPPQRYLREALSARHEAA